MCAPLPRRLQRHPESPLLGRRAPCRCPGAQFNRNILARVWLKKPLEFWLEISLH